MNPSPGELTRRNFIKKSALTGTAITLLTQGTGLAEGEGSVVAASTQCNASCNGLPLPKNSTNNSGVTNPAWGSTQDIVTGTMYYFQLVTCQCTQGHPLGTFRTAYQTAMPGGANIHHYNHPLTDPIPAEHTPGHGH